MGEHIEAVSYGKVVKCQYKESENLLFELAFVGGYDVCLPDENVQCLRRDCR